MSDRVNIQYTIELEELGSEVHRIYKRAQDLVSELELSEFNETNILSSEILSDIEKTRLKLVSLDSTLKDVQNIVSGYLQYKLVPPDTFEDDDVDSDAIEITE
tara:strand:- start:1261 stop:1569 length:309 start_codon:yes stop_codon:yes gene_type:complete